MAFYNANDKSLESGNPIYLMSVIIKNTYRTSFQPKLLVINVEKPVVKGSDDRINFTMNDKAKNESDDPLKGNNYLLRMELPEGDYIIRGLTSISSSFLFYGLFFAPIH